MAGLARRLGGILPHYAQIAWWGLAASQRPGRRPQTVLQAVICSEWGVLLAVRSDLRGWELPGGNPQAGEPDRDALLREVREETGLEVAIERRVGDYIRTGFGPYRARVFACRPEGGSLRPSSETPVVRWFPPGAVPDTLFPWYRAPLADALAGYPEPVLRRERQGLRWVLAGMAIDLRMRLSDDRAGLQPARRGRV